MSNLEQCLELQLLCRYSWTIHKDSLEMVELFSYSLWLISEDHSQFAVPHYC